MYAPSLKHWLGVRVYARARVRAYVRAYVRARALYIYIYIYIYIYWLVMCTQNWNVKIKCI
jgi:hypothetical protein